MEITTESIRRLANRCRDVTDTEAGPRGPIGYPLSLALCIIDAIYSTGSHPTAVGNIVDRYIARHGNADGAKSLRYSIASVGGERAWAETVAHNLKPASTQAGAPLKAAVIDQATRLMADLDIETVPDLLSAVEANPEDNEVLSGWTTLPSQSSKVTYFHLLALAGSAHFEPDLRVRRFLTDITCEFLPPFAEVGPGEDDCPGTAEHESRFAEAVDAEPSDQEVGEAAVDVRPSLGDEWAGPGGDWSPGNGRWDFSGSGFGDHPMEADDARRLISETADVLGMRIDELGRLVWQLAHGRIRPRPRRQDTETWSGLAISAG